MKCLLTGATGFLGKHVLQLLLKDSRVETIHVISRKKKFHFHPKVRVHLGDLTGPWNSQGYVENIDAIIHLAGLYQFNMPLSQCYQHNVLPVLNLVDQIRLLKTKKKPRILYASTYVIGQGAGQAIPEGPLKHLPPFTEPYAYTKALAEKVISDSGYPASLFRLGILVGDQKQGHIEKIDGPYYLMKSLYRLSLLRQSSWIKALPIPAAQEGILPLVPVDCAAQVLHQALFQGASSTNKQEYFGVYHSESMNPYQLGEIIYRHYFPKCKLMPIRQELPEIFLRWQAKLTKVPKEIVEYSMKPVPLVNPHFKEIFGSHLIPHFGQYREAFFSGFQECFLGQSPLSGLIEGI